MSQYFAQLDENDAVTTVHVVTTDFIKENPDRYPGVWVETFFNDANKIYAGVGFTYDYKTQDFVAPPQPPPTPVEQ